jgi:hypothetical protein
MISKFVPRDHNGSLMRKQFFLDLPRCKSYFNKSLLPDPEDATQEILIKMATHMSTFGIDCYDRPKGDGLQSI